MPDRIPFKPNLRILCLNLKVIDVRGGTRINNHHTMGNTLGLNVPNRVFATLGDNCKVASPCDVALETRRTSLILKRSVNPACQPSPSTLLPYLPVGYKIHSRLILTQSCLRTSWRPYLNELVGHMSACTPPKSYTISNDITHM
jgi:hypothetical protein